MKLLPTSETEDPAEVSTPADLQDLAGEQPGAREGVPYQRRECVHSLVYGIRRR